MNDFFKSLNGGTNIPFMNERTKGTISDAYNEPVHIGEFAFLRGENGEYAVFTLVEDPQRFYFGNSIITDMLHSVEDAGMRDQISDAPIVFSSRKSKKFNRFYTTFEFC